MSERASAEGRAESGETLKTALGVARLGSDERPDDSSLNTIATNGRGLREGFQQRKESLGALRNGGPIDYFSLQTSTADEDENYGTPED